MKRKVVLASNNKKKMREMEELLAPLGFEVVSQGSLGVEPAEEPYGTFLENSLAKARHASLVTGLPAIADDSGICVEALGGLPGVHSARWAGTENGDDEANNARLLSMLKDREDRRAHYTCVLVALKNPDDPEPLIAIGKWDGKVVDERAGEGGFGYDPYFRPEGMDKHAAELTAEEKNKVSHRGKAMRLLKEQIIERWVS